MISAFLRPKRDEEVKIGKPIGPKKHPGPGPGRKATPKLRPMCIIFLHSSKQSKEAKQRKRERERERERWRSIFFFSLPRSGRSIAHSPLLSPLAHSLTQEHRRPPSAKAYDYRIVDHTVICHAAAVRPRRSSWHAAAVAKAKAQATDRRCRRTEENRLGSGRADIISFRTQKRGGESVEWWN